MSTSDWTQHYRYGDVDPFNVDHQAVEFACNGTPMRLNRDEVTVAAQQMLGKCSASEMARRCRTDERTVMRILHALGAKKCPECYVFVPVVDGVIGRHIDYKWNGQCATSGRPLREHLEVAS